MPYETLQSETLFHGRAFDVRRDDISLPDGNTARLDIVEHVGAVTLLPVDGDRRLWFVRQYRHAARQMMLELPAGTLGRGEPPMACAARELREETGMAAGELRLLGEFFLAPGYSTEYMHVFLATQLLPNPLPGDPDEFLSVEAIPVEQAYRMAENGEIKDSKSLSALLLAKPYLFP